MRRIIGLGLVLCSAGCVAFPSDDRLFIHSEPTGAEIAIDGQSTGMITPCVLDVGSDSTVELSLRGYPPQRRRTERITRFHLAIFSDGGVATFESPNPLGWVASDLFFPFQWITRNEPTRIHVTFRATDQ